MDLLVDCGILVDDNYFVVQDIALTGEYVESLKTTRTNVVIIPLSKPKEAKMAKKAKESPKSTKIKEIDSKVKKLEKAEKGEPKSYPKKK